MAKDVSLKLATKEISFVLDKCRRKTNVQGAVRVGKGFTLFISYEDNIDIT